MELGPILDVLDKKTILVTGATGFLAKIFVEKILRVQPNVKKLYLLVRATDAKSALQRFNTEVVATDLFKVLKEKYHTNLPNFLSEKVILVPGDITCENLGVKDSSLKEQMWRDVEVVVNAAASTNFNERYDVALAINTFGAKFVSDFGKKCINIKLLLHVSTAYVSRERSGVILETPCHLGEILDINYEKKVTEDKLKVLGSDHNANEESIKLAMKDLGMQRANHYGWSNTYVFTKALGEMTLQHSKGDTPLVILRPTIVTSTYKEPFPGWVDNIKTIDSVIVGYGKGWLKFFPMDPESICDVIPADMVVNAMIATIMANVDRASSETIYHVGSSVSNPLKYTSFLKWAYQYFSQYPWTNKDQQHIVSEFVVLKSMSSFYRYITLRYLLPLQIFKLVNVILCQAFNGTCKNIERKVNRVLRTVKFYQPYVFSTSLYDDINTERLRNEVRVCKHENDIFYFDPSIIDWEDYFLHTHIPGLVRYECK